jgi:hypothetical protein
MTKTHLPKKHDDLLISGNIPAPLPEDDTKYRILGDTAHPLPKTENYQYPFIHTATARAKTKQILYLRLERSTSSSSNLYF